MREKLVSPVTLPEDAAGREWQAKRDGRVARWRHARGSSWYTLPST